MNELEKYIAGLEKLKEDMPKLMNALVVGEGVNIVDEAKRICTQEKIVNTGNYRNQWECSKKALRNGDRYYVRVFNNCDYATHLEYGFRAHFVPGEWMGNSFKYIRGYKKGMYVGKKNGVVPGHYTLHRAMSRTFATQAARIQLRTEAWVKTYTEGKA